MINSDLSRIFYLLILSTLLFNCASDKNTAESPLAKNDNKWQILSPYFSPPVSFKNQFGEFRSPLQFYNGNLVQSKEDWVARRKEIFITWQEMLGAWPPLLNKQRIQKLDSIQRENFIQYEVQFDWIPGQTTKGYLLLPSVPGQKPAVINVYYEPETGIGLGKPFRDYAYQLARRGFVTLSIGTTEATEAETYALYYPNIDSATVQPLSMLGYAAANAWNVLANLQEVDSSRIGIVGHSFGGKWAMFASCLFDKFACAVWSDPGIVYDENRPSVNYWEPWYLGYHPPPWRERGVISDDNPAYGLYPQLRQDKFDLTDLHALMAPRPFLVSGGSEDPPERWIALNHTIAVNNLLGFDNRVGMTNRPEHSPDSISNEYVYTFFEYFLSN